jgi:hypothetical protein
MPFKLRITTNSDASRDGRRDREIARLLREIAGHLEARPTVMSTILDYDGNTVGEWRFTISDR